MQRVHGMFAVVMTVGWLAVATAQVPPGQRNATAPPGGDATSAVPDQPADATRDELTRILEQYPPSLAIVLRLDPTLLNSAEYLRLYPALAAFVERHPEVVHNPAFFLGTAGVGRGGLNLVAASANSRGEGFRAIEGIFESLWVLIGIATFLSLMAWLLKSVIDHRRWLRVSKIQTEVHSKVLDRLTSSEDLLAYIQSPPGRQFLEAAPVPITTARAAISAPVNRILWSVQAGVVLALFGAGLWYARGQVSVDDVAQPLGVLGVLSMFLGGGFAVSAVVAYVVSRVLGLFDASGLQPHA